MADGMNGGAIDVDEEDEAACQASYMPCSLKYFYNPCSSNNVTVSKEMAYAETQRQLSFYATSEDGQGALPAGAFHQPPSTLAAPTSPEEEEDEGFDRCVSAMERWLAKNPASSEDEIVLDLTMWLDDHPESHDALRQLSVAEKQAWLASFKASRNPDADAEKLLKLLGLGLPASQVKPTAPASLVGQPQESKVPKPAAAASLVGQPQESKVPEPAAAASQVGQPQESKVPKPAAAASQVPQPQESKVPSKPAAAASLVTQPQESQVPLKPAAACQVAQSQEFQVLLKRAAPTSQVAQPQESHQVPSKPAAPTSQVAQPQEPQVPLKPAAATSQVAQPHVPSKPAASQVAQPQESKVPQPAASLVQQPLESQVLQPAASLVEQPLESQVPKPAASQVPQPQESKVPSKPAASQVAQLQESRVPLKPAAPASQAVRPSPIQPSDAAIDRRLRRLMAPNSAGLYKVADSIRALWDDQNRRDEVKNLFAQCDYNAARGSHKNM